MKACNASIAAVLLALAATAHGADRFDDLILDGHGYRAVITAIGVYPDGAGDTWPMAVAPTYFVYSDQPLRCDPIPRYTGRESILVLDGQVIPVVRADHPREHRWTFRTAAGVTKCKPIEIKRN